MNDSAPLSADARWNPDSHAVVSWSVVTANRANQPYSFDTRDFTADAEADVRAAFSRWESVADIAFVEVADASTVDIRLGWDSIDGRSGTLGEATWWRQGDDLTRAMIRFDSAEPYQYGTAPTRTGMLDFYTVALHEIGHAIGLPHEDDEAALMGPNLDPAIDDLEPADIEAVQALYGEPDADPDPVETRDEREPAPDPVEAEADPEPEPTRITGTADDERLDQTGGDDIINGGAGQDMVYYAGQRDAFIVTVGPDAVTVDGPEGRDSLIDVERVIFADGTLVVGADDPAQAVNRLYDVILNRTADSGGLRYWTEQSESGAALTGIASGFMASPEFQARFGHLDNRGFVEGLYEFALERSGEVEGVDYWTQRLDAGADRAGIVVGFSESAEAVELVARQVGADGLWLG